MSNQTSVLFIEIEVNSMTCRCFVFFMLNAHYRKSAEFSADLMEAAKNALERITDAAAVLKRTEAAAQTETVQQMQRKDCLHRHRNCKLIKKFEKKLDDFNTADALAAILNWLNCKYKCIK